MSMLSAQIDKLRKLAEYYDGSEVASIMRYAADTIWQLRDDLQRTNDENARLRSELESVGTAAYLYGRSDLKDENKRLRKLVRDLHKALFTLDIDHCQACPRDNINGPCTKFMVCGSDECSIEEDMRELGIEVD